MGADSAVTLSDGAQVRLHQNSIHKIHVLNEAGPVAAMVYGNGVFAGLPWSTVLGQFRQRMGDTQLLSIDAYAQSLIGFLGNLNTDDGLTPDPAAEQDDFSLYIRAFLADYRFRMAGHDWEKPSAISDKIAASALDGFRKAIHFEEIIRPGDDEPSIVPRRALTTDARLGLFLEQNLPRVMAEEMGWIFQGHAFPQAQIKPLMQLATESMMLEWLPDHLYGLTTGLVLSGFGQARAVPSMVSMEFLGAIAGVLKFRILGTATPKAGAEPVFFDTFAQDNMTRAFVFGAMPSFEHNTQLVTTYVLYKALSPVIEQVHRVNPKLAQALDDYLSDLPIVAASVGLKAARHERMSEVVQKLWPLLTSANAERLTQHARNIMQLPVIEHELLSDASVARPVRFLAMERGHYTYTE